MVKRPNGRGGKPKTIVMRKAFHDNALEPIQAYLDKDWCSPYTEDECSVEYRYIKL